MLTFDIYFDLLFGIPDMAIDVVVNVEDNQILEEPMHSHDSTITDERTDAHSLSTSRVNVKGGQDMINIEK